MIRRTFLKFVSLLPFVSLPALAGAVDKPKSGYTYIFYPWFSGDKLTGGSIQLELSSETIKALKELDTVHLWDYYGDGISNEAYETFHYSKLLTFNDMKSIIAARISFNKSNDV